MEFVATNTGTSVGRWEGQTLVVYTAGINPQALYPGTQPGAVPIGANARISERIFLTDAEYAAVRDRDDRAGRADRARSAHARLFAPREDDGERGHVLRR